MRQVLTGISIGILALGGAACDQQTARKERAGTLYQAVVDQLAASENANAKPRLETVKPEERAVFGRLSDQARVQIEQERKRIAVGSIIAKPRVVEQMQAVVRARSSRAAPGVPAPVDVEAEFEAEPPLPQESITLPDAPPLPVPAPPPAPSADEPEALKSSRPPRPQYSKRAPPPPPAVAMPQPVIVSAPEYRDLTEETLQPRVMEAMITAQSSMFEQMDKLGLEGSVSASASSGQMVIDMFASASQLTDGEALSQPFIAEDAVLECPETLARETMQSDKLLATNCMVEILRASGNYEYVEKDFIFDHQFARAPSRPENLLVTPDDALWELQWNFQNNGFEDGQSPGGAGFVDFWTRQKQTGSADVTVAVVDTGLALSHPDIAASPNIAPGWDMVTDPAMGNDGDGRDNDPNDPGDLCNPNKPGASDSYHGTHVAGTIGAAASNNGQGVSGGAWNVKIVPVRALGKCGGRLSDINDAIRWAGGIMPAESAQGELVFNDNPADIINLSIGLFERCPASMQDAIDSVVERGAVVVAAAGNARLGTEFYAPASCQNVITVAAGDARGYIAPYSNFGPEVDVLAPGGNLDRDDNNDGRPDGVLSTRPATDCYDPLTGDPIASCYYAFEQGTSMAAPHVSAALALIAAREPELTGPQISAILMGALMPRDGEQCTASCELYPDATPIPGQPGRCTRSCGGLLNLGILEAPNEQDNP